jgi:hypothetical protein
MKIERLDGPAIQLASDMATLLDRQRQQRADELEQQVAELRAHALQRLAERGETPSPEHWDDWHAYLDIDPDLRGRDYSRTGGAR